MGTVLYVLLAILIFGALVGIHELGHFMAARLCGVRVLEFSIGMGPAVWKRNTKRGTELSLRALPLGGFCAMEGEDGDSDDPAAFANAGVIKRLFILAAGAGMNFLLGLILILICYTQISAFAVPTVTRFMEGCPYEGEQGIMAGDTFYRVNGERTYVAGDVSLYMGRSADEYMDIVLIRDGRKVRLDHYKMTPVAYTDPDTGEQVMRYGFYFEKAESGVLAKLKYTWYCALDFVRMVRLGLTDLITGAAGMDDMVGVVGIVDTIAEVGTGSPSVYDALLNIAYLSALIAVNLAVMNLLPIPALDGGRIFFLLVSWLIERVFRRRLDPRLEGFVNTAGLVLLMGLMVYVMYNDVARILIR